MPTLVKMPKWGLTMESATITEWLCTEGGTVRAGEPLFVAETDKATHDVSAPSDGVLRRIVAAEGSQVGVSGAVAVLAEADETLSDDEVDEFLAAQARPRSVVGKTDVTVARQARHPRSAARDEQGRVRASPAARKLAHELGVDLDSVTATGGGGRITSDDVERAATTGTETTVREDWVRLADGRLVFYVLAGQSGATPLVLIHGLGGSSSSWQMVLETFAETHQVLALDLPGHGQSDTSDPAVVDYSIAGLARVVCEVVSKLGLGSVILVGHSLGGAVAATAALAEPDLVTRLVLVDSAGIGEELNPRLVELATGEPSMTAARDLLSIFFHDDRFILDSGVREFHLAWLRPGAAAAVRAVANSAFGASSQIVALQLARLRQPVLVVWGREDRVIPATHAEVAEAVIPVTTVVVIPGSGHAPHIEAAQAFIDLVERFVADTDS